MEVPYGSEHSSYRRYVQTPSRQTFNIKKLKLWCRHAVELGLDEGALEATTLEEVFMQFQG